MTQNETKSKIIELLKSTNRENIDKVVLPKELGEPRKGLLAVCAACSNHSSHKEHPFRYDLMVSNILKDADALDRCRFYQHGRLDIEMLKYQRESRSLIPLTTAICQPTNVFLEKEVTFADFIGMID